MSKKDTGLNLIQLHQISVELKTDIAQTNALYSNGDIKFKEWLERLADIGLKANQVLGELND